MAHRKKAIDYFQTSSTLFSSQRVKKMLYEANKLAPGMASVIIAIYFYLRSAMSIDQGYWISWNEFLQIDLCRELYLPPALNVEELLQVMVECEMFDSNLYNKEKILTSVEIQEAYFIIINAHGRCCDNKWPYLLIPTDKFIKSRSHSSSGGSPDSLEESVDSSEESPDFPEGSSRIEKEENIIEDGSEDETRAQTHDIQKDVEKNHKCSFVTLAKASEWKEPKRFEHPLVQKRWEEWRDCTIKKGISAEALKLAFDLLSKKEPAVAVASLEHSIPKGYFQLYYDDVVQRAAAQRRAEVQYEYEKVSLFCEPATASRRALDALNIARNLLPLIRTMNISDEEIQKIYTIVSHGICTVFLPLLINNWLKENKEYAEPFIKSKIYIKATL